MDIFSSDTGQFSSYDFQKAWITDKWDSLLTPYTSTQLQVSGWLPETPVLKVFEDYETFDTIPQYEISSEKSWIETAINKVESGANWLGSQASKVIDFIFKPSTSIAQTVSATQKEKENKLDLTQLFSSQSIILWVAIGILTFLMLKKRGKK